MTDQRQAAPPPPSSPITLQTPTGPANAAGPPVPPRKRRNGLLFGCLGAALLLLAVALVAAGGVLFLARRTTTQAQQIIGTSVVSVAALATSAATVSAQSSGVPVAVGARQSATGTVAPQGAAPPRIAATIVPVSAAGATVAPTSRPAGATAVPTSRPAAAHPAGLTQPVAIPGWTVTVTGVERPGQKLIIAADSDTDPVAATGTWVVVALNVTRTANGAAGVDYGDVALRSGQGFTYAVADDYWTTDGFYPAFKHGQPYGKTVPPGATVTYYLTFDVAADAADLQFIFLPDAKNPAVIAIGGATR